MDRQNFLDGLAGLLIIDMILGNSMEYYVTHWIILNICSVICSRLLHWSGVESFCLMVVLSLLIPSMILKIKTKTIK